MENNHLFHKTIVDISNNSQLNDLVEKLRLIVVMLQVGKAMQPVQMDKSHQDHVAIAKGILGGDPIAAEMAMRSHVANSHNWILTLPDSVFKLDR